MNESLADCIERIAAAVSHHPGQHRKEMSELLQQERYRPLAEGVIGRAQLREFGPALYEHLQANSTASTILALGLLRYAPAKDHISHHCLHDELRPAATVALALIDPSLTAKVFGWYTSNNPVAGTRIAGVALDEAHSLSGKTLAKRIYWNLPQPIRFRLKDVPLSRDVRDLIRHDNR